jgi:hypothetical protein
MADQQQVVGARRPVVRRLGTAALVVAALAIGGALSAYKPGPDVKHRPFISDGKQGERVHTRAFDAELLGVRGGEAIASGGVKHESKGVWVIAKVRLTATVEATTVAYAALRDGDDRIFLATGRITQPLGSRELQPGIPVEFEFVFEVPENVPLSLAMRLAVHVLESSNRMDGMAQLELPIGRDELTKWKADKEPLKIMKPVVTGASPGTSPGSGGS